MEAAIKPVTRNTRVAKPSPSASVTSFSPFSFVHWILFIFSTRGNGNGNGRQALVSGSSNAEQGAHFPPACHFISYLTEFHFVSVVLWKECVAIVRDCRCCCDEEAPPLPKSRSVHVLIFFHDFDLCTTGRLTSSVRAAPPSILTHHFDLHHFFFITTIHSPPAPPAATTLAPPFDSTRKTKLLATTQ